MGPKQFHELREALRSFIAEHGSEWPRTLVLADGAPGGVGKLRKLNWSILEKWAAEFVRDSIAEMRRISASAYPSGPTKRELDLERWGAEYGAFEDAEAF